MSKTGRTIRVLTWALGEFMLYPPTGLGKGTEMLHSETGVEGDVIMIKPVMEATIYLMSGDEPIFAEARNVSLEDHGVRVRYQAGGSDFVPYFNVIKIEYRTEVRS